MKLITLNCWGGKLFPRLIPFIKRQAKTTDIFCFQEVFSTDSGRKRTNNERANLYQELQKTLPGFKPYYSPFQTGIDFHGEVRFDLSFGSATFVKKTIPVKTWNEIFVHKERDEAQSDLTAIGRSVLCVTIKRKKRNLTVINFHGLFSQAGKRDTTYRIEQSKKVLRVLKQYTGDDIILLGDFNLMPTTKSFRMIAKGMRDLIAEHGIVSTRSAYFRWPEKFADYILTSPNVNIKKFEVSKVAVSDHLPLALTII